MSQGTNPIMHWSKWPLCLQKLQTRALQLASVLEKKQSHWTVSSLLQTAITAEWSSSACCEVMLPLAWQWSCCSITMSAIKFSSSAGNWQSRSGPRNLDIYFTWPYLQMHFLEHIWGRNVDRMPYNNCSSNILWAFALFPNHFHKY